MGTYSGYAEYYDGFALTAAIDIGSHSDHEEEGRELRRRQAALAGLLAGVGEAAAAAVAHYARGAHAHRRHVGLLDPSRRAWRGPAPEPLWSSERRSRGARLPLAWLRAPSPAPAREDLLSSMEAFPRVEQVDVTLYLASDEVPYLVREVIDGHFVAAQFLPGGAFVALAAAPVPREVLAGALRDAWEGLNRSTLAGLLHLARGTPALVAELARDASDEGVALMAAVTRVFLEPASFVPELAGRARASRQALTLLAQLTSDEHWREHGEALGAMDGALRG